MPETTRDGADVTARLRPDKPAGAYSTRPGVVSAPWHPRYGASKDRQQSPRHAGPAARPNAHGGELDYFRRAGQQHFDFHRDAIAADDDMPRATGMLLARMRTSSSSDKSSSIMAPRPSRRT